MKDDDDKMEAIKAAMVVNRMVESLLDIFQKQRKVTIIVRDPTADLLEIFCTNEADADGPRLLEILRKELEQKAAPKKEPEYVFVGSNDGVVN